MEGLHGVRQHIPTAAFAEPFEDMVCLSEGTGVGESTRKSSDMKPRPEPQLSFSSFSLFPLFFHLSALLCETLTAQSVPHVPTRPYCIDRQQHSNIARSKMERLADDLRKIHVDDSIEEANQVLFRPPTGSGFARTAFHEIPRYLFRVVTPRSDGITDETWARSELACQDPESSTEDVFFNLDDAKRKVIAQTLNLHLRWWPKYSLRDNFVSWTSSLLFAIQYIYYRHLNPKDGSSLEHIKLYAIDTTQFLRGTFLRDLDLIDFFEEFDDHSPEKNLAELHCRRKKDEFYFGEYLSQGALKIEGKCATISAHLLFESNRLRRLQRQFYELQYLPFNKGKPVWAQEVSRLRDTIWGPRNLRSSSLTGIGDRLEAVKEIIQDLDPIWRYPLAIYFTSLIGPVSLIEKRDAAIHNTFFEKLQSSFPKGGFTGFTSEEI